MFNKNANDADLKLGTTAAQTHFCFFPLLLSRPTDQEITNRHKIMNQRKVSPRPQPLDFCFTWGARDGGLVLRHRVPPAQSARTFLLTESLKYSHLPELFSDWIFVLDWTQNRMFWHYEVESKHSDSQHDLCGVRPIDQISQVLCLSLFTCAQLWPNGVTETMLTVRIL